MSEESPPESCEREYDDEGASRGKVGALIPAVAVYVTIASVLILVPSGTFFGHGLAVIAGSVAFAEILCLLRWCGKGHFRTEHLAWMSSRIIATRIAATGVIIFAGYWLSAADALTLVASASFVALLVSHVRTPKRIDKRIAEKGAPQPKTVSRRIVFNPAKREIVLKEIPHSVAEAASEVLDLFGRWSRIPKFAPAVIVVALIICTAALGVGLTTGQWIGEQTAVKPRVAIVTPAKPSLPAMSTPTPTPLASPPNDPPAKRQEWNGECHRVLQRNGATPKAINAIHELYEESGLTTLREGCYGQIVREHYKVKARHHETYFATIGSNLLTGEELSFGIDSERFGPVLFLWSVASLVKAIIEEVGPVGGVGRFPYYEVAGGGEFVLLRCRVSQRVGNVVLLRRDPGEAWTELPTTVARAWLGQMNAVHKWLWPLVAETKANGETLYELQTSEGSPMGAIRASKDLAEIAGTPYPKEPAYELDLPELTKLAAEA